MLNNKRIVVVLPAYNAALTLEKTWNEIPKDVVDDVLMVDDCSSDDTLAVAKRLGIRTIIHEQNLGYGGNQKTCYTEAIRAGADIVVMLHPDYQYTPRLIVALSAMIAYGEYDAALGSRILAQNAIAGGMPRHKYIANRFLTFAQNLLMGCKLSEFHTGFRAFSSDVLKELPLSKNSNDFIFDNQMLAQIHCFGFRIGEVSCPTRYASDSSSINFSRSIQYGIGVLGVSLSYCLHKVFGWRVSIFEKQNSDSGS